MGHDNAIATTVTDIYLGSRREKWEDFSEVEHVMFFFLFKLKNERKTLNFIK